MQGLTTMYSVTHKDLYQTMYKDVVLERDEYTVELEHMAGHLFLHMDVRQFDKDILEMAKKDWQDIQDALYTEGWDRVWAIPEKTGLVNALGWDYQFDTDIYPETRGVYAWDLRPYQ